MAPTISTLKESIAEARKQFFIDAGFDDENIDDVFEDASESVKYTDSLNLLDTIGETCITLNLFLNNHYEDAEKRIAVLSDRSMYHALGHSTILFIKAMMTCDRADMENAVECSTNAAKVIDAFRAKYSIAESLYRISGGNSRRVMTDSEIHAELCYAESLMFRAVLTFFYDENLTSFVRGALKIRSCFQSFKECQRILNTDNWGVRHDEIKSHFECGARMGIGTFSLMLSTLPSKIIRLLEVVGFNGNKPSVFQEVGMSELHLASHIEGTLRHPIVCLSLLSWHLIAVFFIGASDPDIPLCERLMRPLTVKYPNGAIILFLKARLHLIKGDIDNAIYFYGKSISVQDTYKQFHHVCWWELLFAYTYLRKWDRAANNAKKLVDESKWSRCCYTYMLAILINADRSVEKRTETVRILLERVPQIRHRIAGKSIPVEKFCARKSERFLRNGTLFFAHYEFLYFWNGFSILSTNKDLVGPILDDIEAEWNFAATDDKDDESLYLLLKGVSLKILGKLHEAELCFLKIMEYERIVTDFSYIVPNACFELAMTRQSLGLSDQAIILLQKALTYRGYSLETKLHFKIQAAMNALNSQSNASE